MSEFTVRQGKQYYAIIHLGMFESFASNDTIKEKLVDAGFEHVEVTGEDSRRIAIGTWTKNDTTAEMPEQVVFVEEIE